MSAPQALESLRWFRSIAPKFQATLDPSEGRDGRLYLDWQRWNIEYSATFRRDGSLFMRAEEHGTRWDEWAELVQEPGPEAEPRVRAFYMW